MKTWKLVLKIILTVVLSVLCPFVSVGLMLFFLLSGYWEVTAYVSMAVLPATIPVIWLRKYKACWISYCAFLLSFCILFGTQGAMRAYEAATTIDVTPSINEQEYLPFDEDSAIIKIDSQLLDFSDVPKDELPIIDGAAAAFPVYSAFVHAVYPETTELYDGAFEYNNTVRGYRLLGEQETDIFIGAAPSKEQIAEAEENGTTFAYTQIGYEAFVFFVHKDNPIDSLTLEQIKGIYSGQITNWSQVGGDNEKIVPFQRNEGSGSQSMLIRLMGDTPIIEPDMQERVGGMGDIIEEVADYKNKSTSIGFSFRYYVEGIIKNPDIKLIAIDGIAPNVENIQNGTYPVIAPVYAVTYKGNDNPHVQELIDWILSEEGQYIIEKTGYVGMGQ